jgi:hypothetical protein
MSGSDSVAPNGFARTHAMCKVPLPFVSPVASVFTGGVTIHQVAYAQAAVTALVP